MSDVTLLGMERLIRQGKVAVDWDNGVKYYRITERGMQHLTSKIKYVYDRAKAECGAPLPSDIPEVDRVALFVSALMKDVGYSSVALLYRLEFTPYEKL